MVYYAHSSIPVKELVLTTPQMSPPSTTLRERRHQRRAANQQMMPPADPAQGPLVAGSHASRPASRAQGAVGVASNLPISPVQGAVVGMSNPPTMASLDFFSPLGDTAVGTLGSYLPVALASGTTEQVVPSPGTGTTAQGGFLTPDVPTALAGTQAQVGQWGTGSFQGDESSVHEDHPSLASAALLNTSSMSDLGYAESFYSVEEANAGYSLLVSEYLPI